MVNLDVFHRILTFSNNVFDDNTYTVDDIVDEERITKYHNVPLMNEDNYVYHVNDRSDSNFFSKLFLKALTWLPIQDMDVQWNSEYDAMKGINDYYGNILMKPRINKYLTISQELSKLNHYAFLKFLVLEGMASHLCKHNEEIDEYVVDLLYMNNYKVRKGLLPYGASLHLDKNFDVKHIVLPYCVMNGKVVNIKTIYNIHHQDWLLAYNVFTSSLITHVTIKDHAVECHFILAGGMLSAYQDNYKTLNYDLIDLIKPFIFRTGDVNSSALGILVNKGGIVSRLFSFTQKSLDQYMHECFATYNFTYPLENVYSQLPLYRDCKQILNVIESFVQDVVTIMFNKNEMSIESFLLDIGKRIPGIIDSNMDARQNLIRVLSAHIFNVSVWHEHIGNMSQYIMHPKLIRVKPYLSHYNATMETEQNTYQNIFLALTTSATSMPKLNCDLSALNAREYIEAYKKFCDDLNAVRTECNHMNVAELECSVSL